MAVKIVKLLDAYRASGEKEQAILEMFNIVEKESSSKSLANIIQMIDKFEYKKHLCLVFECMEMNLRETLKKFGRGIGLSLDGVRHYAK